MIEKYKSPYTAALTGGGFLFEETLMLLPLLQDENSENLLQEEKVNNHVLHINAETSRKKVITEIRRRYQAVSPSFWDDFKEMSDSDKMIALFYVILKTYKICFDFHVNVTMRKWNSISKSIDKEDLMMEFNEISAKDDFVDSWSDTTKGKVAGAYLTILRKVEMLDKDNHLHSLTCDNYGYYLAKGEPWFLEACLLQPYEINNIKKSMI